MAYAAIPGFTTEQMTSLQAMVAVSIKEAINQAVTATFQATSDPAVHQIVALQPAPLVAPQPLQKPTTENIAEKDTEKAVNTHNTTTVNTGTPSTIPYQAAMQSGRETTISNSNAPLLASFFASLLAFFLAFASPPGYIRFAKDMEATGQG